MGVQKTTWVIPLTVSVDELPVVDVMLGVSMSLRSDTIRFKISRRAGFFSAGRHLPRQAAFPSICLRLRAGFSAREKGHVGFRLPQISYP